MPWPTAPPSIAPRKTAGKKLPPGEPEPSVKEVATSLKTSANSSTPTVSFPSSGGVHGLESGAEHARGDEPQQPDAEPAQRRPLREGQLAEQRAQRAAALSAKQLLGRVQRAHVDDAEQASEQAQREEGGISQPWRKLQLSG